MYSNKAVAYDYTNRAMRYDILYLSGPQTPFLTLLNFTSLWLKDALYMYTFATPLDNTPCVGGAGRGARALCAAAAPHARRAPFPQRAATALSSPLVSA